jgi:hypothetical protein
LKKIVVNVKERRQRLHGGDLGDRLTELGGQTTKVVDHPGWLGNGVTNIVKKISEPLEPAEVVGDGQIGLEQVVELLQGIHGALVYVVEEEALERRPDRMRRWLAEVHHLHDLKL